MGDNGKVTWAKLIWARSNIPRHAFISWVFIQHRLPTKMRLNKYLPQREITCTICNTVAEDETHLFFECNYAKDIWKELSRWWQHLPIAQNSQNLMNAMLKSSGAKTKKHIICAITSAAIYLLWRARNQAIFNKQVISAKQTVYLIKEQVRHKILYLNTISSKYKMYIDSILH